MIKEIFYLIPKMLPSDLNLMERVLNKRFATVAKKFGKGLGSALMGGGIVGAGLGLIDKLLNPLKETQDAIDKMLAQSDDVATNAKQFGTTSGTLFRLQQRAAATGLDAGSLDVLIQKFKSAVAEAVADKTKPSSVRAFTGTKDFAQGFFEFIQSLQKLDPNKRDLVQQEVFGEKQILKMADFLQTDFAAQTKKLGGPTAEQLTPRIEKLGDLKDLQDLLGARRNMADVMAKSATINEEMVRIQNQRLMLDQKRETQNVQNYKTLADISNSVAEMGNVVSKLATETAGAVTRFYKLADKLEGLSESRLFKGLIKIIRAE